MRLRELIFQGVLGAAKPSRLRPGDGLARMALPPGVSVHQVHDLLIACLYPTHLSLEQQEGLRFDASAKLAAVLESSHGVFRVIRRRDAASVRLQIKKKEGYRELAAGASAVESALQKKLFVPPLEVVFPLHLWRFDPEEVPRPSPGAEFGDDPQIPEVIEQYRVALGVEEVEDEITELEGRIELGRDALGKGAKIKDKLQQARDKLDSISVDQLSDEELTLLRSKEEKIEEFRRELERLREQEGQELDAIGKRLPDRPKDRPLFWVGIAVAALALVASVVLYESHRIIALASIPGFLIGGIELLRYYNDLGRASVHKVRLKSIRRRISQVIEEEIMFREKIDHILFHAGVESEEQLQARLPKAAKLRKVIEKLEKKQDAVRRDPEYRRARQELDEMEERLEELQAAREQFPSFVMNSFRLESDLEELGVDPVEVRKWLDRQEGTQEEEELEYSDPFEWMLDVAQKRGLWQKTGLVSGVRSTWSKICGHVLGERFEQVDLSEDGKLTVGSLTEEQQKLWQSTRSSEVRVVLCALALSMQVTAVRTKSSSIFRSVWVAEPGEAMTPGHAEKFESVFKSAARDCQIVICETR